MLSQDPQESYQIGEMARKLANIIRIGQIGKVDYTKAKATVKMGEIETDYLPWITSHAGTSRNWAPLSTGTQVIVLAPDGELNRGVILPSLYRNLYPAPANIENQHTMLFADGSKIEYDTETKSLSLDIKGNLNIVIGGSFNLTAKQAKVSAATTIEGDLNTTGAVNLAGVGPAIARVGDSVVVDANTHQGTITGGSTRVKAG